MPFKDNGIDFQKSSGESSLSLDPENIPDAKAQLNQYQKEYLQELKDMTKVIDHQGEIEIQDWIKGDDPIYCKSCRLFGCLDSPPTTSLSIPGSIKRERSTSSTSTTVEEEILPAHDPNGKNELFFMDLDKVISSKIRGHKRLLLDSLKVDGFNLVHDANEMKTPYSSPTSSPVFLAERELENIDGWYQVFGKLNRFEIDITDSEDSLIDHLSLLETVEVVENAIKEDLEPGEEMELSMIDIAKTIEHASSESRIFACDMDHRPLPIYHFTLDNKKLKTILDTGAATNYVSKYKVEELMKLNNSCIKVYNVKTQGVRLANGDREECSKMASFSINHGTTAFEVQAFIFGLPTVDLILGLPWFKNAKPAIDFETGIYTVNMNKNGISQESEINPYQEDEYSHLCAADKDDLESFEAEIERLANETAKSCFSDNIISMDREWKHSIDTGDHRPVKSRG